MEHQYPGAISGDENMLAELMLPDQAHMRKEDWTIFFLHKDTSEAANQARADASKKKRRKKERDPDESNTEGEDEESSDEEDDSAEVEGEVEEEMEGGEGPPLIYVLNLVNTKQDNTARRFATLVSSSIH